MNDNDINELIKKAKYMIQNNQIPDDIKNIIGNNTQNTNINYNQNGSQNNTKYNSQNSSQNNTKYNFQNNSQNNTEYNSQNGSQNNTKYNPQNDSQSNSQNNTKYNPQNDSQSNSQNNGSFSDIDMETLMKLQSIMSKMKNSENDDMSKLLLSLKPYLRDGRKEKVDEYIQLIKMGKMTELFNSFGGDKK